MRIKVGTFNLNNLFSRYNFKASISEIETGKKQVLYTFDSEELFKIKHFQGRLIKPKSYKETIAVAERIMSMDLDVICVHLNESLR